MTEKYRLIRRVGGRFFHMVHQGQQRRPAAAAFFHGNQAALIVHMEHGLDGQHGAEQRRRGADPAAPFKVVQVVDGEPVADLPLHLSGIGRQLLQAFLLLPGAEPDKQPLPHGGAKAVLHVDFPLRKFLRQLLGGDDSGLVGRGEGGGEAQAQNVLPRFQHRAHGGTKLLRIDGGGDGHLTGPNPAVKLLETDLPAVQQVSVLLPAHVQPQGQHLQAQLLRQLRRKIAAAIGHDYIVCHISLAPFLFFPWVPVPSAPAEGRRSGFPPRRRRSSAGRSGWPRPPEPGHPVRLRPTGRPAPRR